MATRKPKATVAVDIADLQLVLYALAGSAPSQYRPIVCRAAVNLEGTLGDAAGHGIFDIGWGLRAADAS
jgi:hypothetical protein